MSPSQVSLTYYSPEQTVIKNRNGFLGSEMRGAPLFPTTASRSIANFVEGEGRERERWLGCKECIGRTGERKETGQTQHYLPDRGMNWTTKRASNNSSCANILPHVARFFRLSLGWTYLGVNWKRGIQTMPMALPATFR